jgi:hypothetical protein
MMTLGLYQAISGCFNSTTVQDVTSLYRRFFMMSLERYTDIVFANLDHFRNPGFFPGSDQNPCDQYKLDNSDQQDRPVTPPGQQAARERVTTASANNRLARPLAPNE